VWGRRVAMGRAMGQLPLAIPKVALTISRLIKLSF